MILLEESDAFLGVAPLRFVVVLDDVRLVVGVLSWRACLRLCRTWNGESQQCYHRQRGNGEPAKRVCNCDLHSILRVFVVHGCYSHGLCQGKISVPAVMRAVLQSAAQAGVAWQP